MVRDLQVVDAQQVRATQQPRLGSDLGVAGQQGAAAVEVDPQDDRVLVAVERQAPVGGWRQDRHLGAAQGEALPFVDALERHAAGRGDALGLGGGQRDVRRQRRRPDEQHPDRQGGEDGGQPAGVVVVRVGHEDGVERADAPLAEPCEGDVRFGSAVDEEADGAAGVVGHLDEDRVPLTDVEGGDRQVLDRRGRLHRRERRERDGPGDRRDREAWRAAPQQQPGGERQSRRGGEQRRVEPCTGSAPGGGGQDPGDGEAGERGEEPTGGGPCQPDADRGDPHRLRDGGERDREEVRGHRPPGEPLLQGEQERRRAELRTEADGREQAEGAGAPQALGERRGEDEHPRRGGHRQPEAQVPGEQRVDEEQEQRGHRQGMPSIAAPPQEPGAEDERRHEPGPQDRGLPAHEQDVPAEGAESHEAPAAHADAQQPGESQDAGEHECDVPAGDDDEVGEPGVGELGAPLGALPADVAGEQPGEDRRAVVVEVAPGDLPGPLPHRGGDPPAQRGRGALLDRPARGQDRRRMESAQVPVEAVPVERAGRHLGLQGVADLRQPGSGGQAEAGPLPDGHPVEGDDAPHEPGAVLGDARLRHDADLDRGRATPLGERGDRAALGEVGPGTGRAGAEQREARRGDGEAAAPPRRGGGVVEHGGTEEQQGGEEEPGRPGPPAPEPQGAGEQRRRRGAHGPVPSDIDELRERLEALLPDPGDLAELPDRRERTVLLAVVDDPLGGDRADTRQGLEVRRRRVVQVDRAVGADAGRSGAAGTPAAGGSLDVGAPDRIGRRRRHVDLLAVDERPGEVEPVEPGVREGASRGGEGVTDTRPTGQPVHPRSGHTAGDVDDHLALRDDDRGRLLPRCGGLRRRAERAHLRPPHEPDPRRCGEREEEQRRGLRAADPEARNERAGLPEGRGVGPHPADGRGTARAGGEVGVRAWGQRRTSSAPAGGTGALTVGETLAGRPRRVRTAGATLGPDRARGQLRVRPAHQRFTKRAS
jgi:hypothetical protein